MADGLKVKVGADVQLSEADKKINAFNAKLEKLAKHIEAVGKQKVDLPFAAALEDIAEMEKRLSAVVKLNGALQSKMKAAGVSSVLNLDFNKMYMNPTQGAKAAQYVLTQGLGATVENAPKLPMVVPPRTPGAGAGGGASSGGNPWASAGMNILHEGLGATGSWGGALSRGMGGFGMGAGIGAATLVGALAGKAISALVGAVVDKIGAAQTNAIQIDKLIRASGISDYGSAAWKAAFYGSANASGMKINDFTAMASTFAHQGNISGDPRNLAMMTQRAAEFGHGFGVEPTAAAGVFASGSALNLSRDQAGMQKLGLWIGEGIVKSGATAQSQQYMETVQKYMEQQSRYSLGSGNLPGYIGALTSLTGAGIPGMDLTNAGSLLATANSNIQRGGAAGPASQMFMARMAMKNGMSSPFQLQLMQEAGMFATANSTFGEGSMYSRHFRGGPRGDKTLFSMSKKELGNAYGPGTPEYYQALANQFGVSKSQAMALDEINDVDVSQTLNALQGSGVNLQDMNASAIQDLVKVNAQGGARSVASKMLGNPSGYKLDDKETAKLGQALKSGDDKQLTEVINQLLAQHGQVETEGSKTRDSLAQLNNTFQAYADKAVPLLNTMSMAAVVSFGGKQTMEEQFAKILQDESDQRIGTEYKSRRDALLEEKSRLEKTTGGSQTAEGYAKIAEIKSQISALDAEENNVRWRSKQTVNEQAYGNRMGYLPEAQMKEIDKQTLNEAGVKRMQGMEGDIQDASKKFGVDPTIIRGVIYAESRFRNDRTSSAGAEGAMQLIPTTQTGYNHKTQRGNIFAGTAELARLRDRHPNASMEEIFRMYNGGEGYRDTRAYGSKENTEYPFRVQKGMDLTDQAMATGAGGSLSSGDVQVPNSAIGGGGTVKVQADPWEVNINTNDGQPPRREHVPVKAQYVQPHTWSQAFH